ncbi:MCE family protein [Marmoricola sp. URHB0036]|uniref:MCE family protein n=1 Tax=Marmoricola sp. URHB0036 TaxID=1298863 RepID=UPI0003FFC031|nr:MCE family protein [Marmoricola sp. URHB0036]
MTHVIRRRAPRPIAALVLLLVTVLVASGCKFDGAYDLPLPGNKVSAGDAYKVTADFADALNVVPRTAVYANDVVVGQVSDVERVGWHARVTFLVRKDIDLPENVEVDVRQTSLLGEKYIALVEPAPGTASSKRLSNGDFIPLSRTSRNPEVEEVLGALSMVLSGGGIGQLKTISHELNNMMNGRQDQARHVLGNLDRMIGGLDQQKSDIIAAMDSIDKLSSTLVKEKDVIGEAIDSMGPALKVLNRQHRALMTMLRQLDSLGVVGTRVIKASRENIVASLRHLQPTLTRLGDAGDALAPGLSMLASFPFPKEAANIVRGDYANALFHMDIDLNKVIKSPGEVLPNVINLCSSLPLAPACDALSPVLKASVCAVAPQAVIDLLCPPGSAASQKNPIPLPDLGLGNKSGGSGSSSGGSSGGGGLGGLLGLGGGG